MLQTWLIETEGNMGELLYSYRLSYHDQVYQKNFPIYSNRLPIYRIIQEN